MSTSSSNFIDSCVAASVDSARSVARSARGRPTAQKLIKLLSTKRRILISTHMHPDPDALASSIGLRALIQHALPDSDVTVAIKGTFGGGLNMGFAKLSDLELAPWDDARLPEFEAIVLTDVQPNFAYSPLPAGMAPLAIVDHHRSRGRRPKVPFCDIRTDVGAAASIVFGYLMELDVPIDPTLAATLLYAIETDLSGAAGQPGELDNIALSSLTLRADPRKLYQMRHSPLPQAYFATMHRGLSSAMLAPPVLATHLGEVETPEMPAVIADSLLRLDGIDWVLTTALHNGRFVLSLRTQGKGNAGELIRSLVDRLGEGGGHRTKAGGFIRAERARSIEKICKLLRTRLARAVGLPSEIRYARLIPTQLPE